jgi:hypothetical protein
MFPLRTLWQVVDVILTPLSLERIRTLRINLWTGKPLPNRRSFSCKRSKYEAISEQNKLARRPTQIMLWASVTARIQQVPCSRQQGYSQERLTNLVF